uniref:V-set and immunoglobulin domain-containing protein 1-like n=1 Tax=Myxine glutinosa TaxID=7769 RepID=UPI00358E53EC
MTTCPKSSISLFLTISLAAGNAYGLLMDREGPGELKVVKDSEVTLPCSFSSLSPLRNLYVLWTLVPARGRGLRQVIGYMGGQVTGASPIFGSRVGFAESMPGHEASLHIVGVVPRDAGTYTCLVNNYPDPTGGTTTIGLRVLIPPSLPTCGVQGRAEVGGQVNLTCSTEGGEPPPSYSWTPHDGAPRLPSNAALNPRMGTLALRNVTSAESGTYMCRARNSAGVTTCLVNLDIIPAWNPPSAFTSAAIGCPLAAVGTVILIGWLCRRWRRKGRSQEEDTPNDIRMDVPPPRAPPVIRSIPHAPRRPSSLSSLPKLVNGLPPPPPSTSSRRRAQTPLPGPPEHPGLRRESGNGQDSTVRPEAGPGLESKLSQEPWRDHGLGVGRGTGLGWDWDINQESKLERDPGLFKDLGLGHVFGLLGGGGGQPTHCEMGQWPAPRNWAGGCANPVFTTLEHSFDNSGSNTFGLTFPNSASPGKSAPGLPSTTSVTVSDLGPARLAMSSLTSNNLATAGLSSARLASTGINSANLAAFNFATLGPAALTRVSPAGSSLASSSLRLGSKATPDITPPTTSIPALASVTTCSQHSMLSTQGPSTTAQYVVAGNQHPALHFESRGTETEKGIEKLSSLQYCAALGNSMAGTGPAAPHLAAPGGIYAGIPRPCSTGEKLTGNRDASVGWRRVTSIGIR